MFNSTSIAALTTTVIPLASFNETSIPTLSELLDQLGCQMGEIVVNTFILPAVNLIGFVLCSFSFWIFLRPSFEDSIFFYYKLLCFVNIIHLLHNIPYGILYSPLYFPMIDTYASSIYLIYYAFFATFLFHFEEVLQMAILLHKMKLYVPFIRKHFSARPQIISLIFFLVCLLIDLPFAFSFKIVSFGDYSYLNSNNVKQIVAFFYPSSSEFSKSLFGQILLGFTLFFLNFVLSLIVGVTLNIFSYIKYKLYANQRQRNLEELKMSSVHNRPTTSREIDQQRQKEKKNHQIERNMFYMAFTFSSISILSRFLLISGYIYFFIFSSYNSSFKIPLLINSVYTLFPSLSIFVFYSFNEIFRDETKTSFGFE